MCYRYHQLFTFRWKLWLIQRPSEFILVDRIFNNITSITFSNPPFTRNYVNLENTSMEMVNTQMHQIIISL